jgi:uncharacterized protein YchJ
MPNFENKLYRLFCKKCQDFTLHIVIYKDETNHESYLPELFKEENDHASICKCGHHYETVMVSEIPKDKLTEQRERFKKQRQQRFNEQFNIFSAFGGSSFFAPVESKTRVIESDAGLEHEEKILEERRMEKVRLLNIEIERFKHVQRNDVCLCGSGLKYKKCCINKHQ